MQDDRFASPQTRLDKALLTIHDKKTLLTGSRISPSKAAACDSVPFAFRDLVSSWGARGTEYLRSLRPDVQAEGITCGHSGPTCSWLFSQALELDTSDRPAVGKYCHDGLQRTGLTAEMLHTEGLNRRLAHLSCFPGIVVLLSMCALAETAKSECGSVTSSMAPHHQDPALSFFMVAFRALGMVTHCIDHSPWPITLSEFSSNFQLFIEQSCNFEWLRPRRGLPFVRNVAGSTLHDVIPWSQSGVHNHMEVHMRLHWALGAWDNRKYWEHKMKASPGKLAQFRFADKLDFCELARELESFSHNLVCI